MIEISKLSSHYMVRKLEVSDIDDIVRICQQNTVFYDYTCARPTRENILDDMKVAPPGIERSDKYYFGFFKEHELIAVMDLVDGYPNEDTAYIGFFMMNLKYQGNQIGTAIISETADYLRSIGKKAIRLAIDKGNPQATHFWKKNKLVVVKEAGTKLVAERKLG